MQAIDTNMLYLVIGGFIAIVFGIGLFKSDVFKARVTREGVDVEAGKRPTKTVTNIKKIKNNAYVELEQDIVDNHSAETNVSDVDNATVKNKVTKP
jgi:hypothetical protein